MCKRRRACAIARVRASMYASTARRSDRSRAAACERRKSLVNTARTQLNCCSIKFSAGSASQAHLRPRRAVVVAFLSHSLFRSGHLSSQGCCLCFSVRLS